MHENERIWTDSGRREGRAPQVAPWIHLVVINEWPSLSHTLLWFSWIWSRVRRRKYPLHPLMRNCWKKIVVHFTVRQWSCVKVMFLQVYHYIQGVPCDHYPLCIGFQSTGPHPLDIGHGDPTAPARAPRPPATDIWWSRPENLFTWGPPDRADIWWLLKNVENRLKKSTNEWQKNFKTIRTISLHFVWF